MRGFWRFWLVAFIMAMPMAFSGRAFALQTSDTITVTGVVPPHIYIFVDDISKIVKIVSNCTINAKPEVLSSRFPVTRLPLTPQIYKKYLEIKTTHNFNQI